MRAVIFILILIVVAAIVAIASGLVDINQTRPAEVPSIQASDGSVTAKGGQAPAFDVETGSVSVGAQPQNVTVPVPSLRVNQPSDDQPSNDQAPATSSAAN